MTDFMIFSQLTESAFFSQKFPDVGPVILNIQLF